MASGELETKQEGQTYDCTYEGCHKVYSSPVSMNLHIKMKHNGGTKKEREAYAVLILQRRESCSRPSNEERSLPG